MIYEALEERGLKGFLIEIEGSVRNQRAEFIYASVCEKLSLDSVNQLNGCNSANV